MTHAVHLETGRRAKNNLHKCEDCPALVPRQKKRCSPCADLKMLADRRKRDRIRNARNRVGKPLEMAGHEH